jgi:hypothetical protein
MLQRLHRLAFLFVPFLEALHGLIEDATHLRLIVSGLFAAWFEIHSAEGLHLLFVDQARLFNLVLEDPSAALGPVVGQYRKLTS